MRTYPIAALVVAAAIALSSPRRPSGRLRPTAATPYRTHIFAPNFETWTSDSISTLARRSGARYPTLGVPRDAQPGLVHPGVERLLLDLSPAKGMSTPSMWAIQRDNGGRPGSTVAKRFSGIVQKMWDSSQLLRDLTGR
jgi:hypothetical protein